MKTLPTLAAVAIAMALFVSPMVVSAAGSITFTSPASGASYKGSQSYTISGTISPAPTQADQVGITVKNGAGQTVDIASVTVTSGTFSYSTATGGTSAWVTGTYTITATDSYGATGSMAFSYTGTSVASYNVTRALINIQGNLTLIQSEVKADSVSHADILGNLTLLKNQLTTLSDSVSGMSSTITSMSSTISGLGQQISAAQTAAQNAETAANNANSAVSSTQTYVLVVAVLAAITLVLELAILVRKLS